MQQFSLFTILTFYKIATNMKLVNTESLLLKEIEDRYLQTSTLFCGLETNTALLSSIPQYKIKNLKIQAHIKQG